MIRSTGAVIIFFSKRSDLTIRCYQCETAYYYYLVSILYFCEIFFQTLRATDEFRGTRVTRHCVVVQLERYLQHKRVAYCSDSWVSSDEWRENMPSSSQFLGVFPIRPVCVAATTNVAMTRIVHALLVRRRGCPTMMSVYIVRRTKSPSLCKC